jgi:hypothetical protein
MKKFISLLTASLVLLCAASTASATLISGEINFTGGAVVTADSAGTAVDNIVFSTTKVTDDAFLQTGDFSGLEGTSATFSTFNVANALPTTLWTVGDFTFSITDVLVNTISGAGSFKSTLLQGTGIITAAGFEDTSAEWIITANGSSTRVSFSSTAIPAPAGAALLGLSLLGFGFARRNKKA